ncbi:Uma2 family endonuclease [Larkinella rosea]|uniref:Uma2 family endonuclease n=1 Tax=Larkinella rosea TaxID=2025312 RepID=A0A3P1BZN0_9BACT|nr:Uma2 family endonuclease [Larkinella rosea]RRB06462.1 Uma2 family endonuclease [Larkinella rosea]
MNATPVGKTHLTVEEYFKLEESSEIRHEFYKGQIYDMAGSSLRHNRLVRKIAGMLESQPANERCGVFTETVKVEVVKNIYYPYPDVVLTCHPFDLQSQFIIRQPSLIVEVLSKSSVATDRDYKWEEYQKMPSLLYYLLVNQYKVGVELYARVENTDQWTYQRYIQLEDVVVFPRLNFELAIGAIYQGINFTTTEEEPA